MRIIVWLAIVGAIVGMIVVTAPFDRTSGSLLDNLIGWGVGGALPGGAIAALIGGVIAGILWGGSDAMGAGCFGGIFGLIVGPIVLALHDTVGTYFYGVIGDAVWRTMGQSLGEQYGPAILGTGVGLTLGAISGAIIVLLVEQPREVGEWELKFVMPIGRLFVGGGVGALIGLIVGAILGVLVEAVGGITPGVFAGALVGAALGVLATLAGW